MAAHLSAAGIAAHLSAFSPKPSAFITREPAEGAKISVMTASSSAPVRPPAPTRIDWRRAEFILLGLAILSLVSLLISINTISTDLPAHPLIVHVPVVFIPLSVLGALAVTVRPQWFDRYGILLCLCSIIGMSSIFLAENAGGKLQTDLHLQGKAEQLINQHSSAANVLAIVFAGFTLFMLMSFAAHRIGGGMLIGVGFLDGAFSNAGVRIGLKVLLVVLAVVSGYYVYHTGDLGAKAAWQQRLQLAAHGGFGGPPPSP
jgi:uncharacterized membrane protein